MLSLLAQACSRGCGVATRRHSGLSSIVASMTNTIVPAAAMGPAPHSHPSSQKPMEKIGHRNSSVLTSNSNSGFNDTPEAHETSKTSTKGLFNAISSLGTDKKCTDKDLKAISDMLKDKENTITPGIVSKICTKLRYSNNLHGAAECIGLVVEACEESKLTIPLHTTCELLLGLKKFTSEKKYIRDFLVFLRRQLVLSTDPSRTESRHLCHALHGLSSMDSHCSEVRGVLTALVPHIARYSGNISAMHLASALYGLRHMSNEHIEVCIIIEELVPHFENCSEEFSARQVSGCLYSLGNMNAEDHIVRRLLITLAEKVKSCSQPLESQGVGNALYGLKGMSSDFPEVLEVLRVLKPLVENCPDQLNAQNVSNALFGMRRMSNLHPEVTNMLGALQPLVTASADYFSGQCIGNSLGGLRRMGNCPEITGILAALLPKITSSQSPLTAKDLATALYGLQLIKTDSEGREVINSILSALRAKLEACQDQFTRISVANSLYGLRSFNSSNVEVRRLLKALLPKVSSCRDSFHGDHLAIAFYGFRQLSSDEAEVREMLSAMVPFVNGCKDLRSRNVVNILLGLQSVNSDHREVRMVLAALARKLKTCRDQLTSITIFQALTQWKHVKNDNPEVNALILSIPLHNVPKALLRKSREDMVVSHTENTEGEEKRIFS